MAEQKKGKVKPKRLYPRKELMAESRLERGMLEYQLIEATENLEKKTAECDRLAVMLNNANKVAELRADKLTGCFQKIDELERRVQVYKVVAFIEAVSIVLYFLLQGVG